MAKLLQKSQAVKLSKMSRSSSLEKCDMTTQGKTFAHSTVCYERRKMCFAEEKESDRERGKLVEVKKSEFG